MLKHFQKSSFGNIKLSMRLLSITWLTQPMECDRISSTQICESYFETAKIVILKRQKSVFFQRAFKGDSKVIQTIFEQA